MATLSLIPMPWLGQPADPGGAFARGVQTGTQLQQTWTNRALLDLRQQALQLGNQMTALQIKEMQRQVGERQNNTAAFEVLSEVIRANVAQGEFDPLEMDAEILGILSRVPSAMAEPRFQDLLNNFWAPARELRLGQMQLEEQREQAQQARERAQTAGLAQTKQTIETPTGTATFEAPESQLSLDELTDLAERFNMEMGEINQQGEGKLVRPRVGRETEFTPSGSVIIREGVPGGADRVETRQISGEIRGGLQSLEALEELNQLITPETIGAGAVLKREFFDPVAGQLDSAFGTDLRNDLSAGKRAELESTLRTAQSALSRSLKTDANIAEPERQQILSALPEAKMVEDVEGARSRVRQLQRVSAMKIMANIDWLRQKNQNPNLKAPAEAARYLKPEEIKKWVNRGVLTIEQGTFGLKNSVFQQETEEKIKRALGK